MKSLVRLANGDMRKALNILQVSAKLLLSLNCLSSLFSFKLTKLFNGGNLF